jgi:glycosyltransferase involved in cell wall biosynthesis
VKIGIELRQLVPGASGGISQLVKGVCEHAFAAYPEHEFLVFCTAFNRGELEYEGAHVRYFSSNTYAYFSELDRLATEEGIDVLFRMYPMDDPLVFPLEKQIFLIPDNQHETFPEFFHPEDLRRRRIGFARALGQAGAIGTISEFARDTLLAFPETRCDDIFLMPPALQVSHRSQKAGEELSESERALIPRGDFFLFPANLWKHKNHLRLLQAFRLHRDRTGRDVTLILTGHPAGWSELAAEFADLPVFHLGYVRPQFLRALMERARALVFFSLYEGFGIPLLEAFDAGTPVICSNTTSLPEVGGDAVLACDPTDVGAMAALMERILGDDILRRTLVRRGKHRLRAYSWEESAHSLVAACARVAGKPSRTPAAFAAESRERMPLVSIVTPSYNQGRFLRRTIESVLTQGYPNIEYVVIDGGSRDETVEILESYGSRFYWESKPDRGQADAIRKGFARVKGEILAYLNSDDVLAPGAIERVVRFFQENPSCDMIYGNADYIDEQDRVIGTYRTAEYSYNRLVEDCMVCQPAAFWRRRIAEEVGPFDEQLHYTMDYDYWLRIAKVGGDIRFLPEKLACSRLYPETKTRSARTKIYREIFKICRKHAGYVHQSFYQGFWHHLLHEKFAGASRLLRVSPGLHARLGILHHKWAHPRRYSLAQVIAPTARMVVDRFAAGRKPKGPAIASTSDPPQRALPIVGFLTDNWLEPRLSIPPKGRAPGELLRIAGWAPVDLEMSVRAGDREIRKVEFKAHQYKKVSFPADLVGNDRIEILFSAFMEDAANRRLSFMLQDTNIFSEQDTYC